MGHWNQRKKLKRVSVSIKVLLALVSILFITLFLNFNSFLSYQIENHLIYVLMFCAFFLLFTIYFKQLMPSLYVFCFLILSFGYIGQYGNVFFDDRYKGEENIEILFINGDVDRLDISRDIDIVGFGGNLSLSWSNMQTTYESLIDLSPNYQAYFSINNIAPDKKIAFLTFSFKGIPYDEVKLVLNNLSDFVSKQDFPIIIFGDFGVPSWSKPFRDFISTSSLDVKNSLIFADGTHKYNPFLIPTINILGHKNMGINYIKLVRQTKGSKKIYPIIFNVSL